jgi:hypothetical protein
MRPAIAKGWRLFGAVRGWFREAELASVSGLPNTI